MEIRELPIHQAAQWLAETPGSVLLDVRTPEEFRQGHLPGAVNHPLEQLGDFPAHVADLSTPILAYCHSGARSYRACVLLERLGYSQPINLWGVMRYTGPLIKEE